MSLETTRERKEKGGERGEKKKGSAGTHNFYIAYLEIVSERQKSARDTPLGHLNRAVPFSKIRVYIGMKWAKKGQEMLKRPLISQNSVIFCHLTTIACNIYWIFEKVGPEDLPILAGTTPKPGFWTPMSLETTRERKEKGGERGEKKKGLLALIIFILPTLEIVSERQKSARDTPLGHLNRAVPFSKIRVYIGMKWAKKAKKC